MCSDSKARKHYTFLPQHSYNQSFRESLTLQIYSLHFTPAIHNSHLSASFFKSAQAFLGNIIARIFSFIHVLFKQIM